MDGTLRVELALNEENTGAKLSRKVAIYERCTYARIARGYRGYPRKKDRRHPPKGVS